MAWITYAEIKGVPTPIAKSELIKEANAFTKDKHVFLSHSHLDRALLGGAIALFNRLGAPVYLDFDDSDLPRVTSVVTGILLRERIRSCRRFVVVASENLGRSKWVPWELGFADGSKEFPFVALMPLVPSKANSPNIEQEYLSIYPTIETFAANDGKRYWGVRNPKDSRHWKLDEWLRGG